MLKIWLKDSSLKFVISLFLLHIGSTTIRIFETLTAEVKTWIQVDFNKLGAALLVWHF